MFEWTKLLSNKRDLADRSVHLTQGSRLNPTFSPLSFSLPLFLSLLFLLLSLSLSVLSSLSVKLCQTIFPIILPRLYFLFIFPSFNSSLFLLSPLSLSLSTHISSSPLLQPLASSTTGLDVPQPPARGGGASEHQGLVGGVPGADGAPGPGGRWRWRQRRRLPGEAGLAGRPRRPGVRAADQHEARQHGPAEGEWNTSQRASQTSLFNEGETIVPVTVRGWDSSRPGSVQMRIF